MSIINNNLLLADEEGGYRIERSLRFRSSASAYLNRTPSTAGNRRTWTWSGWVKRSGLGTTQAIFSDNEVSNFSQIEFGSNNKIRFGLGSGGTNPVIDTQAVFRDVSAWYHIVCVANTTNATGNDRMQIYVNGVRQAVTAIVDFPPSLNYDGGINRAVSHSIGRNSFYGFYFDGYLTEVNFVDGQALTPSSFGETDALTGVWKPKKYAGTYGTNGFYLNFKDNASTSALGTDYSGNGNNWTTNNISLTAGATYDSMIDVPTPYADGGNGRGNYATLNPLIRVVSGVTLSNGNLTFANSNTSVADAVYSTFGLSSNSAINIGSELNYYFEATLTQANTGGLNNPQYVGVGDRVYRRDGTNAGGSAFGDTYTTGDVIGVAVDAVSQLIYFYKNNVLQGTQTVPNTQFRNPVVSGYFNIIWDVNFGQRPFAYTPPTGFKALNTQNLPEPTIVDGGEYFNTVLYTGNGSTRTITGVGFQPDFVWVKNRTEGHNNVLQDVVRSFGQTRNLSSNQTQAEGQDQDGVITAAGADGFTVAIGTGAGSGTNKNGNAYVGWNWKANGAGVTNTAGSITSTVSANPTAGFSIVTYTGNATSGATVGHGLGVVPAMIITKRRDASSDWAVSHVAYANTSLLFLSSTSALVTGAGTRLQRTNSSVFTVGDAADYNVTNASGGTYVAYCFATVAGYSRFGSYTGNGSADGPFVFCGFRPRWLMTKNAGNNVQGWTIQNPEGQVFNVIDNYLFAQSSNAQGSGFAKVDFLSNGFKLRDADNLANQSGNTIIFAAFAENPFKYSLAR
jgi:hypothetical protein